MTSRPHGTRRRYISGPDQNDQPGKGCRCTRCTNANSAFNRAARRRTAERRWTNTPAFVDAEPVRQHVRALMAAGPGWEHIATTAGVSSGCVRALLYSIVGRPLTQRMRPDLADKLLAVRLEQLLKPRTYIDATGTRRRIQALVAIGWSVAEQSRRMNQAPTTMWRLSESKVTVRIARQVSALYDELSMTPAPTDWASERARARAVSKGWPPPLAWDDDTIDDPAATPDLGAKTLREIALAENSEELFKQGYTFEQAADRLGVKRGYLDKARRRAQERMSA